MGVPTEIIIMIILIMSMFAIAAFIIYKNRDKILHTIDQKPISQSTSINDVQKNKE